MRGVTRLSCLFLFLIVVAGAEPYEFVQGELPVLIVNVHGGRELLPGAPIRTKKESLDPQFSTKKDLVTDVLAHRYHQELKQAIGERPSLLVSHIHRKHVDLNRPSELAGESPAAKAAHKGFHQALETEIQRLKRRHGWVLVMDIHGQSAEKTDVILGTRQGQSIGPWATQVLWGPDGVLKALSEARFTTAPSRPDAAYRFGGGYITQHYGMDTQVEVVQLEHGQALRFRAADNTRFIRIFCQVLAKHLRIRAASTWFLSW